MWPDQGFPLVWLHPFVSSLWRVRHLSLTGFLLEFSISTTAWPKKAWLMIEIKCSSWNLCCVVCAGTCIPISRLGSGFWLSHDDFRPLAALGSGLNSQGQDLVSSKCLGLIRILIWVGLAVGLAVVAIVTLIPKQRLEVSYIFKLIIIFRVSKLSSSICQDT